MLKGEEKAKGSWGDLYARGRVLYFRPSAFVPFESLQVSHALGSSI